MLCTGLPGFFPKVTSVSYIILLFLALRTGTLALTSANSVALLKLSNICNTNCGNQFCSKTYQPLEVHVCKTLSPLFPQAVVFSILHRGSCSNFSRGGGHVLQTLFPKTSDGGGVAPTLSLHCFLFCTTPDQVTISPVFPQAKLHYMKIISELRTFGGKCFMATLVVSTFIFILF